MILLFRLALAIMRSGFGISSIKASNEKRSSMQERGHKLAQENLALLSQQLSLLRQKVESFAHKRVELSRIQANPEAASKFYAICNRLGIHQIAIQPSEAVEVQELGIRVCEVLFAARQFSGGLISWKDLRLKTRCAPTDCDDDKLRRAIASLAPLGFTCEIVNIGNEKQASNLNDVVSFSNAIQTASVNDKMDISKASSQSASNQHHHQYSNCWIKCGQLANDSTLGFEALQVLKELQLSNGQSIHSLQTKLAWKPASKLQHVLDSLLGEGILWIDDGQDFGKERLFWLSSE